MSGISTDVIALGAILGSAAVGGVVTLALADRPADSEWEVSYECATTVVETAPHVVVSVGGVGEAVVVAPDVSVREEPCAKVVRIDEMNAVHLDRARAEMDRARARMERARHRMERVEMRELERHLERYNGELEGLRIELDGLEDALVIDLDGLDELIELQLGNLDQLIELELEGLDEALEVEIEGRLDDEMRRLEERLERLDRGNGR